MSESTPETITLPAEFVQPALAELKIALDKQFSSEVYVRLDASNVERIDSAALQFLVAFSNCDFASVPCVLNIGEPLVLALSDIGVGDDEIEHLYGGTVAVLDQAA